MENLLQKDPPDSYGDPVTWSNLARAPMAMSCDLLFSNTNMTSLTARGQLQMHETEMAFGRADWQAQTISDRYITEA